MTRANRAPPSASPRVRRRLLLALGAALMLGAPLGSGVMCVRVSRPVARALERGSGGPHGLPGCSPTVAWMLAPIQREVQTATGACLVVGVLGFVLGLLMVRRGTGRR